MIFSIPGSIMEIICWLIILFGPILFNSLDDFQIVEPGSTFCKLDQIFKNISNKYEERKYLGTFTAYMLNANSTSTYHLLLLLSNDINPNPGPPSIFQTENKTIVSYSRDQLFSLGSAKVSISQHLNDTISI